MKQMTLIADNYLGIVSDISETLAQHKINIENLDAHLVGGMVIIVLEVDQYDHALELLHPFENLKIVTEDAILVKLKNQPGALARITRRFTNAGIGLRSIRFIQRNEEVGLVAISAERSEETLQLIADVLVA